MKKIMGLMVLVVLMTGCAGGRVRNRWTDPAHRVMILADKVEETTYVQIQTSVIESNRFFVVDRSRGFKAIRAEQRMIHRDDVDRFDDPEKYAWYGKMFSVGAVIVPHESCRAVFSFFGGREGDSCRQYLSAIDTSTGEVIVAIQTIEQGDHAYEKPTWDNAVDKLVSAFPSKWEPKQYDKKMLEYREVTSEHSRRQRVSQVNEKEGNE